ncbi:MAG: LOG family protein [Polyangiaceae bacterium]
MRRPSEHPVPVAYRNPAFVDGEEGRPLRILAEYLEPLARLRRERIHDMIVFFGSARLKEDGPLGRYYAEARELSRRVTEWSMSLSAPHRFVVCSGGGGGIMEAANRGASDAGGRSVGLNIGLPHEQRPNPYVPRELSFQFHYFFMRKLWFCHLARALVVFPGGLGTLDEMTEMLTLAQTQKLERDLPVILYGSEYWREVLNFDALVRHGMIDPADLSLFRTVNDPASALEILKTTLNIEPATATPAFAKSRVAQ